MRKCTVIAISLLILLLPSYSIGQKSKKDKSNISKELTEKDSVEITAIFIEANKNKILGNMMAATDLYKECIKRNPNHDASLYELARIYYTMNMLDKAEDFIARAIEINAENSWYKLFLAEIYQNSSQFEKAATLYKELTENEPENLEHLFNWAACELYSHNYKEALELYDRIEGMIGITEDISLQKEKIYLRMNKVGKAIEEIQKLIDANPNEASNYGLLAELYEADGKPEKAIETFNKLQEIDPENPNISLSLAKFYLNQGDKEKSFEQMKIAFANVKLDIDTKIKIILTYYVTDEYEKFKNDAFDLIRILIDTHPEDPKPYSVYGDFLKREGKINEAIEQFEKVISIDNSKYLVWEQLLLLYSENNDFESMREKTHMAIELFPEQPLLYLMNGAANMQQKKYDAAIVSLEKGVKFIIDNDPFFAQFYTYLGDAYYQNENAEESFKAYDKALIYDPNNIYVLNNYSYYLSLKEKDLEKAKLMAKKATKIEPNSSTYLDTYGWVLYKLGEYEEAKNNIEKSIEYGGKNNAIILEHLGDIYFKLENTEKALEYWKKAKQAGEGTEFLEKKIKDEKLYE